jgi:hypothetical protein
VKIFCEKSDSIGEEIYKTDQQRQEAVWRVPVADPEISPYLVLKRATNSILEGYNALWEDFSILNAARSSHSEGLKARAERARTNYTSKVRYASRLMYSFDRCPFITGKGYVGLVAADARPGDIIYIIFGAAVPFVFREVSNGRYQLLGNACP